MWSVSHNSTCDDWWFSHCVIKSFLLAQQHRLPVRLWGVPGKRRPLLSRRLLQPPNRQKSDSKLFWEREEDIRRFDEGCTLCKGNEHHAEEDLLFLQPQNHDDQPANSREPGRSPTWQRSEVPPVCGTDSSAETGRNNKFTWLLPADLISCRLMQQLHCF